MPAPRNPLAQRKARVLEQWLAAARDERVRLLRWQVTPAERQFIEVFFAEQNRPGAELPDVFLTFEAPFAVHQPYGEQLHAELSRKFREALESGAAAGRGWSPITPRPGAADVDSFLVNLGSFYRAHQDSFQHVAAALAPLSIEDPHRWMLWLQAAMHRLPSPRLKLVVFDAATAPSMEPLARAEPVLVRSTLADLDLAGALEEQSLLGGLDHPGAQVRHAFVKASNAVASGDLVSALRLGTDGLEFAKGHAFFGAAVGLHFVLAGALSAAGKLSEAVQHYYAAEATALEAEKHGDPLGAKLRVDARFAVGAVMIGAFSWRQAAAWYEQTVPCAQHAGDLRKELEAWRLVSYASERAGDFPKAWNAGVSGLGVAQRMSEEQRRASTLSFLGEGLARITEQRSYRDYRRAVEQQMERLLGPGWREPAPRNSTVGG